MNAIDAIRAEIDELLLHPIARRLRALETAAELLEGASLEQPVESPPRVPARAKPRAPKPSRRRGGGPAEGRPTLDEIVAFLVQHGPASRSQIAGALGGKPSTVKRKTLALVSEGRIVASGETTNRVYRAAGSSPAPTAANEAVVSSGVEARSLFAAVRDHGPIVVGQLRRLVDRPIADVQTDVEALLQRSAIEAVGSGSARLVWAAGQPRDLEREILAIVDYAPNELNEPRIVKQLGAQFEAVVDAVATLVNDGQLVRDDARMLSMAGAA